MNLIEKCVVLSALLFFAFVLGWHRGHKDADRWYAMHPKYAFPANVIICGDTKFIWFEVGVTCHEQTSQRIYP